MSLQARTPLRSGALIQEHTSPTVKLICLVSLCSTVNHMIRVGLVLLRDASQANSPLS